jgi:acyl carrier protein
MSAFNREDTHQKIVTIIAKKLQIDPSQVQHHATLQDLGADSLDIVEIVILIEEQLGVAINDADAQQLHTVDDVVTYVDGLRKK